MVSKIDRKITTIEEFEDWKKNSKIYEIKFKGKIFIRDIISREEFQKEFDEYIKGILFQLEEHYYITGAKMFNDTKFHKIKISKKQDNIRGRLTWPITMRLPIKFRDKKSEQIKNKK